MRSIVLLLFFCFNKINLGNSVFINNVYKYSILKEVRYLKLSNVSDIKIFIGDTYIPYEIINGIIDLENYYPLDSIKIIANDNFEQISFFQDDILSAVVYYSGASSYQIDDFIIMDGEWYDIDMHYYLDDIKTRKFKKMYRDFDHIDAYCSNFV